MPSFAPLQFLRSPWNYYVWTAVDNDIDQRTSLVLYLGNAGTTPDNDLDVYDPGCILIHRAERQIYLNKGNNVTPDWQPFGPGTNTLPTPFIAGYVLTNDGMEAFWSLVDLATMVTGLLDSDHIDIEDLANNNDFIDFLIANNYFTTSLANDPNFITVLGNNSDFINTLTSNTLFQNNVNSFVTGGGGGSMVINQLPDTGSFSPLTGAINGSNTVYSVSSGEYVAGKLFVFINGIVQQNGTDYTESDAASGEFTMTIAPVSGDVITAIYSDTATILDDHKVFATATDSNASYLDDKFEVTSDDNSVEVTKTLLSPGGNEKIKYDLHVSGSNGSLLASTQILAVSAENAGSIAGRPGGNVLTDAATKRIFVDINPNFAGQGTLRIFKNDYGSYYVENTITVTLAVLSSTNGTTLDGIIWTKDDNYLYALVRYRRTSSGSYTKIDVLRYNLDGTGLVATNIYTGGVSGGDSLEWNGNDSAAVVVGTDLYTTWFSSSTNQFRKYAISGTSYTLTTTYTVSGTIGDAFALSYDSITSRFYLCGGNLGGQQIQKYQIIGSVLTADGASYTYPEFDYMTNMPDYNGVYYSRIENFQAPSYTIYTINIVGYEENGGDIHRSYWLTAVTFPKI